MAAQMKKTMYDFTQASDFLRDEAQTTPEQVLEDVRGAMCHIQDIEYSHGENKVSQDIFSVLLTCADFFERITVKEVAV